MSISLYSQIKKKAKVITLPIKLSSYCTLLNIRKVIDDSVDEILEAQIIERSKSPLSFFLL